MKTKKIALCGLFTALSLILFVVEAQIPLPVPVPGIKLGLANIITVTALYLLGRKEACIILLVRIFLGSLYAGFSALPYSLCGGICSMAAVLLVRRLLQKKQQWVTGVLGAVAHNLGQLAMAAVLTQTPSILIYLPVLVLAGLATGVLTGFCTQLATTRLEKIFQSKNTSV